MVVVVVLLAVVVAVDVFVDVVVDDANWVVAVGGIMGRFYCLFFSRKRRPQQHIVGVFVCVREKISVIPNELVH